MHQLAKKQDAFALVLRALALVLVFHVRALVRVEVLAKNEFPA